MVDYWETVRGLKKGDCPNSTKLLYGAYVRWVKSQAGMEAVDIGTFTNYLLSRGYIKHQYKSGPICWFLNKYIVPKSALCLQI